MSDAIGICHDCGDEIEIDFLGHLDHACKGKLPRCPACRKFLPTDAAFHEHVKGCKPAGLAPARTGRWRWWAALLGGRS